jgi:hypothetical protein
LYVERDVGECIYKGVVYLGVILVSGLIPRRRKHVTEIMHDGNYVAKSGISEHFLSSFGNNLKLPKDLA